MTKRKSTKSTKLWASKTPGKSKLLVVALAVALLGSGYVFVTRADSSFSTYHIDQGVQGVSKRGKVVNEPNLVTGKAWETNPTYNRNRENKPAYVSQRFRVGDRSFSACAPVRFLTPNTRVQLALYKGDGTWISTATYRGTWTDTPSKYYCLSNNFSGKPSQVPNNAVLKITVIRGKARIGDTYVGSYENMQNVYCGIKMIGNPNYDRSLGCTVNSSQDPTVTTEAEALSVPEDAPAQ